MQANNSLALVLEDDAGYRNTIGNECKRRGLKPLMVVKVRAIREHGFDCICEDDGGEFDRMILFTEHFDVAVVGGCLGQSRWDKTKPCGPQPCLHGWAVAPHLSRITQQTIFTSSEANNAMMVSCAIDVAQKRSTHWKSSALVVFLQQLGDYLEQFGFPVQQEEQIHGDDGVRAELVGATY